MDEIRSLVPPGAVLLVIWYFLLVYVALLVAVLVALYIYFDAERKGREATTLLALALICVILVVPSFLLAFLPELMITYPDLIVPLGYVGLLGGLGTIVVAFAYAMGARPEPIGPSTLPPTRRVAPESRPSPPPISRAPRPDPTRLIGEQVAPAAWLVLKTGGQAGRQLSLKRGNNTIGRSHECDVVVEEGTVSGEHARIRFENGQFVIYDLASLNGTFVNGRRTQRQLLMDNDEIRLGQLRLVFKKA